jgi:hypothetical protein
VSHWQTDLNSSVQFGGDDVIAGRGSWRAEVFEPDATSALPYCHPALERYEKARSGDSRNSLCGTASLG